MNKSILNMLADIPGCKPTLSYHDCDLTTLERISSVLGKGHYGRFNTTMWISWKAGDVVVNAYLPDAKEKDNDSD